MAELSIIDIIIAILLFGFIVLVHEFGHFLFAKLNGIGVVEFSIGMGPRLFSVVRGETRYSIKLLPFGGSCMMVGEDEQQADPKAFNNKPVWARISVIAAGPVFNMILAFLFAFIVVSIQGHDYPVISEVMDHLPAAEAGLEPGDRITMINRQTISSSRDISLYFMSHPGETVTISYRRDEGGSQIQGTAKITPVYAAERKSHMIGIRFVPPQPVTSAGELVSCSAYELKYWVSTTFTSLRMLVQKQVALDEAVSGPIGIVSMVGETIESGREQGPVSVLYYLSFWVLLLSANLGIMNLLPLPALDGGRLVFLFLELLRGKPVDPEKEGMVHMAGMMVLMALMVLILFNDVRNLL